MEHGTSHDHHTASGHVERHSDAADMSDRASSQRARASSLHHMSRESNHSHDEAKIASRESHRLEAQESPSDSAGNSSGKDRRQSQSSSDSNREKGRMQPFEMDDGEEQGPDDPERRRPGLLSRAVSAARQRLSAWGGPGMPHTLTTSTMRNNRIARTATMPVRSGWQKFSDLCSRELNFYRIHLLVFTFTPLIFAAIFYASNTTPIPFIDCLFVCMSAMTVTGLVTYNVSTSSDWQQAMLFFLMCIGNLMAVSVTMVLIRRHFFRLKFEDVIRKSAKARKRMNDIEIAEQTERRKQLIHLQRMMGLRKKHRRHDSDSPHSGNGTPLSLTSTASTDEIAAAEIKAEREQARKRDKARKKGQKGQRTPLRADMIRRMEGPAQLVNPMGDFSHTIEDKRASGQDGSASLRLNRSRESSAPGGGILDTDAVHPTGDAPAIRIEEPLTSPSEMRGARTSSPENISDDESPAEAPKRGHVRRHSMPAENLSAPDGSNSLHAGHDAQRRRDAFQRAQTIEFADPPHAHEHQQTYGRSTAIGHSPSAIAATYDGEPSMRHRPSQLGGTNFERSATMMTARSQARRMSGIPITRTHTAAKNSGFGGFPTPIEIAGSAVRKILPRVQQKFDRTTTMGRTATFASGATGMHSMNEEESVVYAPYLSFDAFVSRNSRFHELSEAQRDELGGVEYRAIDLLSKLLLTYILGLLGIFLIMVGPWAASPSAQTLHEVLESQGPHVVDPGWAWVFNCVSAFTNTGMSLIDTSMINLATQYFMLIPMGFLILAGNTAFPIFLRLFIWLCSLVVPKKSRTYETLRFLLDHPRRCFVYLFPSGQTWFLLLVLIVLNSTDWIFFEILDLGNPVIEAWGVGQRIFDGLFQSFAVRAAGFQIVSLLQVAPALQFLYIVMMYISAYPIAMSVRNTNVYEEKSLGIYHDEVPDAEEPENSNNYRVWGTYLAAHARRQLAFDMWWLGFSLWLICIIERTQIEDEATNNYFTVFTCLFELTSAYGTVGLSTGTPTDNFSLSGRFRTLSKLVVIAVMLRGRHRGLPVAIDRAVMLPSELAVEDDINDGRMVMDEDGVLRPAAVANGGGDGTHMDPAAEDENDGLQKPARSQSGYMPRTATGVSMSGTTRGMKRYMSREKSLATQNDVDDALRSPTWWSRGSVMEPEKDEKAAGSAPADFHNLSPTKSDGSHRLRRPAPARNLTAITEAGYSPAESPTPNHERPSASSMTHDVPLQKHSGGNGETMHSTPSASSVMEGGSNASSSQHSSKKGKEREGGEQSHAHEARNSEAREARLAERFGCPAGENAHLRQSREELDVKDAKP